MNRIKVGKAMPVQRILKTSGPATTSQPLRRFMPAVLACLLGCGFLLAGCPRVTETPSGCYHPQTTVFAVPFGVNLDPMRAQQLGVDWESIFDDLDYLADFNPFYLRVTFRAQWMQQSVTYDDQGVAHVTWDRGSGSYYEQVSRIVELAQANGRNYPILGIFYGTPAFNSTTGSYGSGVPVDVAVWRDFVRTILLEFPQVRHWEIWNEPDMTISWEGTVKEFADRIYLPAVELIRDISPGIVVIAPSWAQNCHRTSFLPFDTYAYPLFGWYGEVQQYDFGRGDLSEFIIAIGGREAFDLWGVHAYANFALTAEEWSLTVQGYACQWDLWLQELTGNDYRDCGLWITEVGINTTPEGITDQMAATWFSTFIDDQFLSYNDYLDTRDSPGFEHRDPYVPAMNVYELYDEHPFNPDGAFLGLFAGVGQPKQVADLYRQKISQFYR